MSIVTAISALLAYGLRRDLKYGDMQNSMVGVVGQDMGAIYLFLFIGLTVNALMINGAIPTLMYYGFGLISSTYFYFSAFAFCSAISMTIGSSLTTYVTIGVAFMGMEAMFHADLAMTTGATVSDTFFSDKIPPLSDTTGITTSIIGIDLFEYIENMIYTTIPTWVISAALML